ncbi:MAG: amino acid permease, partial [Lentisphaerae bacterium]
MPSSHKLARNLTSLDIFCLATGAMISSGIFVLPGIAYARTGPSVIISYLLAGVMVAIGMYNTLELATAMPKAGGDYFFVSRTLGPVVGSIAGILNWFSLSLKSAFALTGLAAMIQLYLGWNMHLVGLVLGAVFIILNLAGSKHVGNFQIVLVAVLLLIMGYYIYHGSYHFSLKPFLDFAPYGAHRILATAGFVFVAYGGLLKIPSVAEEVRDPRRDLPRGMIGALLTVVALYVTMVAIAIATLPPAKLASSLTPIQESASTFLGKPGIFAIGLAATLAFVTTANAGIMASSRYLYALSTDNYLPPFFSRLNARTGVPVGAVIVSGIFITAVQHLNREILVTAASLVLIFSFLLSCVCVLV